MLLKDMKPGEKELSFSSGPDKLNIAGVFLLLARFPAPSLKSRGLRLWEIRWKSNFAALSSA